jgi:hypothetical protein
MRRIDLIELLTILSDFGISKPVGLMNFDFLLKLLCTHCCQCLLKNKL